MNKTGKSIFFLSIFVFISALAMAQEVKIELGPDEVAMNETFNIKLTVSGEKIKSYDQFPDIPGFQKQGISQSSSMNIINGQMSSSNSIIQYYKPLRKGQDRKSTRLNSSHVKISYAVFCLKKKKNTKCNTII